MYFTKKLVDIPDGLLMREFNITPEIIKSQNETENIELFQFINSHYEQKLLQVLGINAKKINELSLLQQKDLGLTGSGKDIFVTVDENDIQNGFEFRTLCHNGINTNNKIHRAADWIVINDRGEILLAKRSMGKDSYPGYWEIGGGHVDGFDSYELTLKRELEEELNIGENDIKKITPIIKFLHKDDLQNQFIKVFSVVVNSCANIKNNDGEIDDKKFFSIYDLILNINNIFDGKETDIKMIPHQIYCILKYLESIGLKIDYLYEKYNFWISNNPSLKGFSIIKELVV